VLLVLLRLAELLELCLDLFEVLLGGIVQGVCEPPHRLHTNCQNQRREPGENLLQNILTTYVANHLPSQSSSFRANAVVASAARKPITTTMYHVFILLYFCCAGADF